MDIRKEMLHKDLMLVKVSLGGYCSIFKPQIIQVLAGQDQQQIDKIGTLSIWSYDNVLPWQED